jgi:hypothetical protein
MEVVYRPTGTTSQAKRVLEPRLVATPSGTQRANVGDYIVRNEPLDTSGRIVESVWSPEEFKRDFEVIGC